MKKVLLPVVVIVASFLTLGAVAKPAPEKKVSIAEFYSYTQSLQEMINNPEAK